MNPYAFRRYIISGIIILTFLIYLSRLFYLQIINVSFKNSADNNSRRFITQYPARGIIYDRNGKQMVYNQAAYDVMITPIQLQPFDTVQLCNILQITPQYVRSSVKSARQYSVYKPSIFLKQISSTTYALFEEKLYKYPGFFVQTRTLRKYERKIAAHVLGYVGEVDDNITQSDSYYKSGDYAGISGLEKSYEKELRGKKGVNILLVDVHNRIKGSFQNGRYDTTATVGENLITTLDADLQEYGEFLMQHMRGSAVAIEPSTGEILAMVSSPGYDPGLLIGRSRATNYQNLQNDPQKPLFFRAAMANYPPGSTFKIINGLIGLTEGVVTPNTIYSCNGGYNYGGPKPLACTHVHGSINLIQAIQESCNTYFCNVFKTIMDNRKYSTLNASYNVWRNDVMSFGLGQRLNTDIPNELSGNVPSSEYYDRVFGKDRWKSLTVISLAIGQAEMGITPLQLANVTATIANRGFYFTPHLVKQIDQDNEIDRRFYVKHITPFDTSVYNIIIQGMYGAVNEPGGTANLSSIKLSDIVICGKTGTAQNPHGLNHSVFIAFAPKDNPKIAIAVYIENAGFGATWAAPVASMMIEKYLKGNTSRTDVENYLLSYRQKQ